MGKLKLKNVDGRIQMINCLGKFERVNYEELKVLQNHAISRLLPAAVFSRWGKIQMEVKVRGVMPLQAYYSMMNAQTALNFVWETVNTAMECERMGLRPEKLCWDTNHIFVEPGRGAVYMVYWPVVMLECNDEQMVRFYSSMIPWLANGLLPLDFVNSYKAYFHQRQHMDLPQFYQMLRGLFEQLQHAGKQKQQKKEAAFVSRSQNLRTGDTAAYDAWLEKGAQKILLISDTTVIGRDKSVCQVVISDDPGFSRRHAQIQRKGDRFYITDMNSRNGIWVGSTKIAPQQPVLLQNGDSIHISRSTYVFRVQKRNRTILIHQV